MKAIKGLALVCILGILVACGGVVPTPQANDTELETQGRRIIRVTTSSGEFNNDGDCSLREAMTAAHENRVVDACNAGHPRIQDVIELQANATYTLYEVDNHSSSFSGLNGLPAIVTPNNGQNKLLIRGNNATVTRSLSAPRFRIFGTVNGLTLENLTIRNGYTSPAKGDPALSLAGGGLYMRRTLDSQAKQSLANVLPALSNVTFEGNFARIGGAAFIRGKVKLSRLTVHTNEATFEGGGLSLGSNVALLDSLIINNKAADGGGIYTTDIDEAFRSRSLIFNTSVIDNEAEGAAGINADFAHLYGVTISGNKGLGLSVKNSRVYSSTIAHNEGVGVAFDSGVLFRNSIIANNDVRDCSWLGNNPSAYEQILYSSQYSLDSDKSCPLQSTNGNLRGVDPVLKPLSQTAHDNRFTHSIHPLSPAINHGDPTFTPPSLSEQDGRGAPRVWFGRVDIGAYESQEAFELPFP